MSRRIIIRRDRVRYSLQVIGSIFFSTILPKVRALNDFLFEQLTENTPVILFIDEATPDEYCSLPNCFSCG